MTMTDSPDKPPIPETIEGSMSHRPPARGGSSSRLGRHKRSNSADLAQSYQHQQQQQHHMMMMMHGPGSSGSLGSSNSSYAYGAVYGAGVVPPPPPPAAYQQYYAYGPPAYNNPPPPPASHGTRSSSPRPAGNRARAWSGDPSMFDRQQQAQWMATMQLPQHTSSEPSYGMQTYGAGGTMPPGPPRSSQRHRRSNSGSSVGSGGGGGSNNNGGQFSPRSEFMKLANVNPSGSPRGSPRSQYGYNHKTPVGLSPAAYPPPQAYQTMYDDFERGGVAGGNGRTSPYVSPEKKMYTGGSGSLPPFVVPPEQALYGSGNLVTSSLGSAGGEAVYLAQQARGMHGSNGPSSSRKRHMRQKSVQLFMKDIKGVQQPPACRDVFFLLLFVFHLFGMVLLSNMYSYVALENNPEDQTTGFTVNYQNLLIIAGCCGAFAIVVSTILLGVMSYFAHNFVQIALIMAIALSFVWGTLGIGLSPQNLVPITGIVALALSVAYAIVVWDRVPFSTANLLTALSAVRQYPSTIIMTGVSQLLGLGWSIYFAVVCCGVYDAIEQGRIDVSHRLAVAIYVLLGISYYWTIQVFLNAVQVATASVVGEWWYQPKGSETSSKSSFNTIFYAMGSICFGSLVVGPIKVLRQLSIFFRPSSNENSLLLFHECLHCIQTCITDCVEGIVARFNPWGFAYVGLYGYAFPQASSLTTELFAKRGWTTIVSDDLVSNVLLITSVVIGGVTGCVGFLLAGLERLHVTSLDSPGVASFFVGLVVGLVLTSILFGAITGSVNAVIILFATSPVDFDHNHHQLSHEMRSAWREVWPGCVDDVDARLAIASISGGAPSPAIARSSPRVGPMTGVVPPPPPMVPEYAQIGERTPLMNER